METAICETRTASLSDPLVDAATRRLRTDGFAVLEQVVPLAKIRRWRDAFMPLLAAFIRSSGSNRGQHRYCQLLPFIAPFDDRDFLMHPLALRVMRNLLGDDLVCGLFAADTPMPGADAQKVHRDITPLFSGLGVTLPPVSLVVNIPLVDYTEDNGPMEIWPGGTHLLPDDIDPEASAPQMHSLRLRLRAGDLLIRDLRTWHRGTPNSSLQPRPNLTATYTKPRYRLDERPVTVPESVFLGLDDDTRRVLRLSRVVPDADEERLRYREWNR